MAPMTSDSLSAPASESLPPQPNGSLDPRSVEPHGEDPNGSLGPPLSGSLGGHSVEPLDASRDTDVLPIIADAHRAFDIVRRGYSREQVDLYVSQLDAETRHALMER